MLRFALATLLASSVIGSEDAGWGLLATSSGAEVPRTCYNISGLTNLPEWAHGSFIISGPAKFEMGGIKFQALFDGYARVNRFELREGEACYTSVWLNTSYYLAAEKLGEIGPGVLFEGTTPDRPKCPKPFCDLSAPLPDNNFVNLLPMAGEGLLLSDSPLMLNLDLETLAVSGEHAWEDAAGRNPSWMPKYHTSTAGSAHPIRRPKTEATYVAVMLSLSIMPTEPDYVSIYSIDTANGSRRDLIANVPVKALQYFHSYGVSEHYVVLPCNMKFAARLEDLIGRPYMMDNFEESWDGIHLVDVEGNVQKFDTEKFFHVHVANTFENETGVVMDLGAFSGLPFVKGPQLDIPLFNNKTARDGITDHAELRRYVFHLEGEKKGQVTWQTVSTPGRTVDFFKINDNWNGLPYCYVYSIEWFHDGEAYANMAIVKQNMCTGERTYWSATDNYPGEPFFIPGPGPAEDDGLVICVVLDGPKGTSKLVVLDGKTFNEVATMELPMHIPFLAHGQFIQAAALKAAKAMEEGNLLRDIAFLV